MEQCKLCLQSVATLRDSHFLSAGIYRILRDDNEKNPNPWVLSGKGAVQISRQMKAHLLCADCEQRFSKFGERWVLKHCLRKDGTFLLKSTLSARTPDISSPPNPTKIYYASGIPDINIEALSYFAASIFWRGSIYPWNDDGSIPVNLGPFQEQFRTYLMGQAAFPKDASLWFVVREGKQIDRLTYAPIGARQGNFHAYKFPMPGFAFSMLVSKNIPANHRERCFVHGPENPVIVTTLIDKLLVDDAVKMRQKALDRIPA
jgi:hypothetical protein